MRLGRYYCRTNLDDFKLVDWPTDFLFPPRVGDTVEGRQGERGPGSRPRLRVVAVTHSMGKTEIGGRDEGPIVEVELHR